MGMMRPGTSRGSQAGMGKVSFLVSRGHGQRFQHVPMMKRCNLNMSGCLRRKIFVCFSMYLNLQVLIA